MFNFSLEKVANSINNQCQKLDSKAPIKWFGRTITPFFENCSTFHPYAKTSLCVSACFAAFGLGCFTSYQLNKKIQINKKIQSSNKKLITINKELLAKNKELLKERIEILKKSITEKRKKLESN